jgi:hyaluronate lyase
MKTICTKLLLTLVAAAALCVGSTNAALVGAVALGFVCTAVVALDSVLRGKAFVFRGSSTAAVVFLSLVLSVVVAKPSALAMSAPDSTVIAMHGNESVDDIARMRQNALNFWRAIGASRGGARLADALAKLSGDAQSALDTIQPNGSWADVDYSDVLPDATWSLDRHYNRLQDLARAWATPGATLYQDVATRTAMLNAIDYIETVVNSSSDLSNGNWWWWQIGIPERYGPALLLLREELGAARINQTAATLDYLIGPTLRNGTEGSQNWIWQGTNRIYHGLLADNAGSITQGAGFIADYVFIATPGVNNGIMPDFSFQAHGGNVSTGYRSQLATGQYGASFMRYVPQFTFFAEGTSYQLTPAMQQILADFALEGSRWMVFGQFMDISVEGRAYTRDDRNAQNVLSGLLALANTPGSPAQSEAAASAKRILQDWSLPLRPEEAGLAGRLETNDEAPAQPVGFRPYNFSDYAIARTDEWFISLKTISDRNLIGESINGENLRGRHLASGVTWILTGEEYRINNVIPTLDHQRLPGTTVEAGLDLSRTYHYGPGLRSFVGGASIGGSGSSAMDFHSRTHFPGESNLEAKKSWFFFGDSMVALGSGISATTNRRVETIVNQRPMAAIGDAITVDGLVQPAATGTTSHSGITWVHEGAVGYVFPGAADVQLKRANQSGRWSDIGSRSSDLHSNPMFSLWFDHGTAPGGASYAYAVLPNANAATTQAAAEDNTFEVLAQTAALHAVKHHGDNAVGAVFWQAGEIDRVRVDTPSVVFWDINGSTLELALSEPGHNSTIVEMTFAGELTPVRLLPGITIQVSGGSTFISFEVEDGRNYDCTFTIDSLGSLP